MTNKNKIQMVLLLVGIIAAVWVIPTPSIQAKAITYFPFPSAVCGQGVHIGNPHCSSSPSPTLSPSLSPSPSPTIQPCVDIDLVEAWKDEVEIVCSSSTPSATPTATPSATPSVVPTSTVTPSPSPTPEAQVQVFTTIPRPDYCHSTLPPAPLNLFVDSGTPNDGKVEVRWTPVGGAQLAHIRYGETQDSFPYALLNTPNDGHEVIGDLKNKQHYWFEVAQVDGNCVGAYSNAFDPMP